MSTIIPRTLSVLAVLLSPLGCGGSSPTPLAEAAPPSLASSPAQKAAMELGSAQALEKSRKNKQAVEAYRRIVSEYPESPQAKIAGDKIKAMTGK